jgi:hypothetical protein
MSYLVSSWAVLLYLQASMIVYSSRGRWVFPTSCGVFLPMSLSQAFLLLIAGRRPPLLPEPLRPAQLVYLQFREGFPFSPSSALSAPHPLCNMSLLFLLLITHFLLFFLVGVVLSTGLCCSGPGLSVGVPRYC